MKKTLLTLAIILTMTLGASAQGGLFGYGEVSKDNYQGTANRDEVPLLNLPSAHGQEYDTQGPLGSGALLLIGLGAAYALKKRKEDNI